MKQKEGRGFLLSGGRQLDLVKEYGFKDYTSTQWREIILSWLRVARRDGGAWCTERGRWMRGSLAGGISRMRRYWQEYTGGGKTLALPLILKKPIFYAGVIGGLLAVGGTLYLGENSPAYAVFYQGRQLGYVSSVAAGDKLQTSVEEGLERKLGLRVSLPGELQYRFSYTPIANLVSRNNVKQAINSLPWQIRAVEMSINGKPVAVLPSRAVAKQVLDRISKSYQNLLPGEKLQDVKIADKISYQTKLVPVDRLLSEEQAVAFLQNQKRKAKRYQVQAGDNLWIIARKNDMMVADLIDANPGLTEKLQIGQEINLAVNEPLVNVEASTILVAREDIPYDTQIRSDSTMSEGSSRVIQEGAPGKRTATYQIIRRNGAIVLKNMIASLTLQSPVARVVAQGGQAPRRIAYSASRGYYSRGSGTLGWPLSGPITDTFGSRGGEHQGIDIGVGTGTPVHAAAGGVVTVAGWESGYGLTVIISHGNGLQTLYAHLSKTYVHAGQRVGQGQPIAASGATGHVTGPHLHFGVMVGGSYVNPYRYL